MTAIRVAEGAWIDYRGQRWHLERRQGSTMEWRCRATLTHMAFTDNQLQKEIAAGKARFFNGIGREHRQGKSSRVHGQRNATKLDEEEARRKLIYVLAIRDAGMPSEDKGPDDWLDIIDAVYEDQGRTWKRLRTRTGETVDKPSLKSVRRWVVDAGAPPKWEKLVPRHRHKGNYDDRLDPALREFISQMVDEHYLRRPAITLDDLKVRIEGALTAFNEGRVKAGHTPFPIPGVVAIQSSIDMIPKDEVKRARYGEMAAFLSYGSAEAQADPEAPLDRVELDATRMDLFVVDPDSGLPIGRPTLVVVLDRCTRMVLGWFVTFEAPSIGALMQALRNAILPKDYLDEVAEERGWIIKNRPETYGVPRVLVLDRARENIAESVAIFAMRAGINRVEIMAGKKPWLKGAIERVIKAISEKLLHPARGTTLHNILKRMDYDPLKDAVCTPDDLDYALHKYFIDVYPFEPRRSLNGRQAIKVWREKTEEHPVDSIGHIDEVAHLFGRTDRAKPGRFGINAHSMQYFSPELLAARKSSEFQKALARQGGKLEFRTDPTCIDLIHVQLPHEERVIPVPVASKWTRYATGLSLWHHRKIREYIKADASTDADTLLQAKLELMEIMKGSAISKRGGLRARGMLARMEGVQRHARAGTDASNTVPGSGAHHPKVIEHSNDAHRDTMPAVRLATDDGAPVRDSTVAAVKPTVVTTPAENPRSARPRKGYRP